MASWHSSQFMELQKLGITALKHAACAPNAFKIAGKSNNYRFCYLTLSNCVTISHINYWNQVNSWKDLWKFWKGLLCRIKSGPFPLLDVARYWKSSNTKACTKKLSQILANKIMKGGDWSQNLLGLHWAIPEKSKQGGLKTWNFQKLHV